MSQLETNTTDLQAILAQVNALPDAGSGGGSGGSVETCTVEVKSDYGDFKYVSATVFSDGKVGSYLHLQENGTTNTLTIENVICGSVVTVEISATVEPASTVNGAEQLYVYFGSTFTFKITAGNNETATITVYEND